MDRAACLSRGQHPSIHGKRSSSTISNVHNWRNEHKFILRRTSTIHVQYAVGGLIGCQQPERLKKNRPEICCPSAWLSSPPTIPEHPRTFPQAALLAASLLHPTCLFQARSWTQPIFCSAGRGQSKGQRDHRRFEQQKLRFLRHGCSKRDQDVSWWLTRRRRGKVM